MVELSESLIIQLHCWNGLHADQWLVKSWKKKRMEFCLNCIMKTQQVLRKDFRKDRDSMIASILEYGNPFEEEEQNLVHIISRHVLDNVATKSVKEAKRMGDDQYTAFINERLINRRIPLYDTLNDLSLFRQKHLLKMSKSKQNIAILNPERRFYAKLYVAC